MNIGTEIEKRCQDKDNKFCPSYVRIYGDRICKEEWFISETGRYGCKKSCKICSCQDKDGNFCPSYVRIYGDQVCSKDWFTSDDGRYGCKKSCKIC